MYTLIDLYFDGACDNNSKFKYMGLGVAVMVGSTYRPDLSKSIMYGTNGTNNIAEWQALIVALTTAREMLMLPEFRGRSVSMRIYGDSLVIINQFKGVYNVNKPHLVPYYNEAKELRGRFIVAKFAIIWVRRDENKLADALSTKAVKDFIAKLEK